MERQELEEKVKTMFLNREQESDIREFLKNESGLRKTARNTLFLKLKSQARNEPVEIQDKVIKKTKDKKYFYNPETKHYVVFIKSAGKNVSFDLATHKEIQKNYVNNMPVSEIAIKFGIPADYIPDYRAAFGWVRGGCVLCDEEVENTTVEKCVEQLLEDKKFQVYQDFNKAVWLNTVKNSEKWEEFQVGVLDKLEKILSDWEPTKRSKIKPTKTLGGPLIFCAGLNDTHIGELFEAKDDFSGKDFNSETAASLIDDYFEQIKKTFSNSKEKYGKILVFVNGDYLNSTIDNFTRRGTELHSDLVNEKLFQKGLDVLIKFVENCYTLTEDLEVLVQKGNHDSVILTYLAIAAKNYFKDIDGIRFHIPSSWASLYRYNNVALVLTHGSHDSIRAKGVPSANTPGKLKAYIQDLILSRREDLVGVTQILVITGHRHSYAQLDMGSFEFFCFGGLPLGDHYSLANNWHSKSRQNCLVLNENGVQSVFHYYF